MAVKRRAILDEQPQHVHGCLGGLVLHHLARSDEVERADRLDLTNDDADRNRAHRLLWCATAGAGDSGDANSDVGPGPLADSDGHGARHWFADRAVSVDER